MSNLNRKTRVLSRALRECSPTTRRAGTTLLELILAMALSVIVLGSVAMAISLFLRTLDARRSQVEETQIARAVLRMIADDLHSAVQQEKLDFSQTGSLATVAANSVADAVGGTAGGTGGTTGRGGATGGSGGGSTGGGSGGGSGGGTSGGSGGAGGSTSGGSTGTPSTGGSGGASGTGSSTASQDIEETTVPPPVPGIFGNQYQLQIDFSRVPRLDELMMQQSPTAGSSVVDLPSDVKTVAYYIRVSQAQPGTGFSAATQGSALGREMRRPGLVRRQLDRAVTMYASQGGRSTDLQHNEKLIAPEVVGVEFRYFDGTQWLTSWDSIEQNRLPAAVEIIVAVQPGGEQFQGSNSASNAPTTSTVQPLLFRQLVRLPAARACPDPPAEQTTDASATSGTGGAGSSGTGSGTGSTSGSGATSGS